MLRHHHQTFCTVCGAPLGTESLVCRCGARSSPVVAPSAFRTPGTSNERNPILVRLLGVTPIIVLLAVGGGLLQRHTAEQEWLASTYTAAVSAAAAGDLIEARNTFSAIAGYGDVDHRISEIDKQLEPLE